MKTLSIAVAGLSMAACANRAPHGADAPAAEAPAAEQVEAAEPSDGARPDRHHADADTELETVPVASNIYMLVGRGGNIGVSVGDDGILIIDDKFEPLADDIRAALGALSEGKLAFVINTHHHPDHTGANPVLGEDSTIIAHANARRRLAERGMSERGLPVITFDASLSVHFNDQEIEAVHYENGHTDTDSVIFFRGANVIHMGDLFFNGKYPYIDLDAGGDVASYIDNVAAILDGVDADTQIIPGHGPLASRADLEAFHTMLTETVAHVTGQIEAGKTLAEIQEAGLPNRFASWDGGFVTGDKWIATIYRSR